MALRTLHAPAQEQLLPVFRRSTADLVKLASGTGVVGQISETLLAHMNAANLH